MNLLVIAVGLAACSTNGSGESGHISALRSGDLSRPATRGSPVAELRAACGEGALTTAGTHDIRRRPYLQQVTSTSAMIGWVTVSQATARVEVTTPGRAPVQTAPAEIESTTVLPASEHQLWAQLDGLEPDTIYCYALSDDVAQLTEPTGFRTPPAADSARPLRFLVFGDSGVGSSDQYALLEQMYTVPHDLIIHVGDIAQSKGSIDEYEHFVFDVYGDLLRNVPIFPVAGNHDHGTLHGAPFRSVFALPGGGDEAWYAFDWGKVHFAALDTELDYKAQAAWLDRDLASTELPWKIVYLHKPPYSSGEHGSDLALRAVLAPILERHHVQLVLSGHDHDYERTVPQDGVVYAVTGGGGAGTRDVGSSSFTAFSEQVIHCLYGEVGNDELVLHAIDATGVEFDAAVVPR